MQGHASPPFLCLTLNCSSGDSLPHSPQPRPAQSVRLSSKLIAAQAPVSNSCFPEAEPAGVSHGLSILQLGFPKDTGKPKLLSPLPRSPPPSPRLANEPATAPCPRGPPLSRLSPSTESRCPARPDTPWADAAPEAQSQDTGPAGRQVAHTSLLPSPGSCIFMSRTTPG